MTSSRPALPTSGLLCLLVLVGSCGGSSTAPPPEEQPQPTTVTVTPSAHTLRAIGATVQFTATVRDELNRAMPAAVVTWSTPDATVASIDSQGLATAQGDGTATIVARASATAVGWADLTVLTVPLAITTTSLPPGVVGLDYDVTLEAEGGTIPVWSVSAGTLPSGLTLDGSAGRLSGVPESAGTTTFTVTLASAGQTVAGDFTLVVHSGDFGIGLADDQFALIPAGTFQMGSTNGNADEQPVHTVNITRAFHLQKTEVTQHQWEAVMGSNPSVFRGCGPTCPVDAVSWDDVQAFITALNAMDPGKSYRLPTEAEWEYAARAGTVGDYGGSGVLDEMGWYLGNGGSASHSVALKAPNAWGLYDMHGNVMEWVQDYYAAGYYAVSPTDDPAGPVTGDPRLWGYSRIFRGGSADRAAATARSADRFEANPTLRGYSLSGFRLARGG